MHVANKKLIAAALLLFLPALLTCAVPADKNSAALAVQHAATKQPNIVLILLDDVGFADLGAFGAEINTPNIDSLANSGLRYTHFTNTGVCSPSRAALLTGLNHHSAGVGWLANIDSGQPGYRGEISPQVQTLPEQLSAAGYSTFMVGKWHLTNSVHLTAAAAKDSWPLQRGFERFWGILDGEASQFNPAFLFRGNDRIEVPQDGSFYFPDAMTAEALSMLTAQQASTPGKPWLLYYATAAAHAPHHTKAIDREKYLGRYAGGYDQLRAARLAKQKKLGLVPDNTRLAGVYPGVLHWSELSADERKVSARLQENYAAFVDNLDQQIGRLLDYLRATKQLDNTLIMLASDNGGSRETGGVGTTMATRYFNGIADTTEKNLELMADIGNPNTHANYPHGWMQVSNTPFPFSKATVHGGGVRSPLIVHWPTGIKAQGELRHQFHHINDLMPTLMEAARIKNEMKSASLKAKPAEGVSMLYSFDDAKVATRKLGQYYEIEANRAYVSDGWKIVSRVEPGEAYDSAPWELYHLTEDFSESADLAARYPERVEQMASKWWQDAERYQVLPINDQSIAERGRAAFAKLPTIKQREFNFSPDQSTIHPIAAPLVRGRDFTINISVEDYKPGQQGVLLAQGGYDVGYVVYLKNNRIVYEANIGDYRSQLGTVANLPTGNLNIALTFRKDLDSQADSTGVGEFAQRSANSAQLTIQINGSEVASGIITPAVPANTWEGLDIGLDRRSAVSKNYQAPFRFNGELKNVRYMFQ